MQLRDLQQAFRKSVTAKFPSDGKLPIRETDTFSKTQRLEVYRYAYRARILDSLKEDFPKLRKALGAKRFEAIALSFLEERPSRHPNLAEYSEELIHFLKKTPLLTGDRSRYVALADYEWTRILSWLEENGPPGNLGELAALSESELIRVKFRLHPSAYLREYPYAVERSLTVKKTRLLLYHQHTVFKSRLLTPVEWDLLKALHRGATLKELEKIQIKKHHHKKVDHFSKWVKEGIIYRFERNSSR